MGEGCGSWFPRPQFTWQSPYLSSLTAPLPLGHQTTIPKFINPDTNMVSTASGALSVYANTELPHLQVGQVNELRGCFDCLPRFRQAFTPASNPILKEQLLANVSDNHGEATAPKAGSGCTQKRFLVFDQSGDQTTLIFSPALGTPVQCPNSWSSKALGAYNPNGEHPMAKGDLNLHLGPISGAAFDGNGADVQSEMHEDTEELNALLYSDDDGNYTDDDDDDDTASTGHSPSTMTAHNEQLEGSTEEVASSGGTTKKRKLFDGVNDYAPLLMDTATSVKPKLSCEYEHDAESSCANGKISQSNELSSLSANKRMRKEKIRETVCLLRSIIPNGEGKDAIMVLDEAIGYLKSLRFKAKDLGFGTA
ncbi:hypothetical protein SLE2022_115170 [Rubroshorea leprosula]